MENKGMPYNSDDRTVAQINGIEPLAGKETYVTTNVRQGPTYGVFWPEGKDFGSTSGPPLSEVTIDDPVKRAIAENNANESERYGRSSSKSPRRSSSSNKRSSSRRQDSTSASQKRRESKKALPDYDDIELPGRGDSQRKLTSRDYPEDSYACCYCRMSARCTVIIVVIVMLLVAAGIIAGVIAATHESKGADLAKALPPAEGEDNSRMGAPYGTPDCTEFTKHKDKFALGTEFRQGIRTIEDCAKACLNNNVCGGYDFDRLKNKCFLAIGAVGPELLQNAPTTDHFERQFVCNKTDKPLVCHMVHSSDGNAAGGHNAGVTSLEECNRLCLLEDGCKGIDYNYHTGGTCWVHTVTDTTTSNACCEHYSKVCKRCRYTEQQDRYERSAIPQSLTKLKEASHCGDLCNLRPDCTGFDFEYLPNKCSLIFVKNFTTLSLEGSITYKKGQCFDIEAPT